MSFRSNGTFQPIICCARSTGELGELEAGAGASYSWLGRPSIDPELIQIATVPINFRLGPGLQPADLSTAAAR